jgi:hypothetical protein
VNNGRDDVDSWLEREVTPLLPPPGTLDRIRRTARRRKTMQAVTAAVGCAVIIGAGAAVPQVMASLNHSHGSRPPPAAAQSSPSVSVSVSAGSPRPSSRSATSSPAQGTQGSRLSASTSGAPVPADFRPTSATFVGTGSGAEVGAVIGQAGDASHPCATSDCTSLAGTSTYGSTWYGVSAPRTPGPASRDGVSQLRFSNLSDGWAFGPGLWETSTGGSQWKQEDTYGLQVTDLETVDGRAFAIFASCSGTGQDYAATCTRFSLYTSTAGSTPWSPVTVPPGFTMTTSAASAATLVIAGTTGTAYLLTPSGAVLTGAVTGGAWTRAGTAPCEPGPAQAGGQPAGAQLAAGPSLVLACDSGPTATIYTSADGAQWRPVGKLTVSGTPTALTATNPDTIVLATTARIYYSTSSGTSWHAASLSGAAPGGFSYVGMTTASFGVAVPADAQLDEVFVTTDGGQTWTPSPIAS